ncbi:unnamed protein product [Enterobius vermicularis]|uniref:Gamma-aminobutyric acid receptor subunit beta n=1 Tax=Enterobius vermicularis TaxID=51028 RepID=A0A0N4VAK3_ENTVE|nr:unnamed protein product [Enterobius vermicularis]
MQLIANQQNIINVFYSFICQTYAVDISQILDSLVDNTTYNKQLRPQFGGKPTEVTVSIRVSTISSISEVNMDFTVDLYLRQMWNDPRLAFFDKYELPIEEIQPITVGLDYLSLLWRPDTFFPNAKQTNYHSATTRNLFLRIDPIGNVFTSERLTVTAVCQMDLRLYPMDTQKCKLEIESYGYSILDIIYSLEKSTNSITVESFELPQFQFIEAKSLTKIEQTASGKHSRLICIFLLKRNVGFYVIQIYLPSVLIVTLSWVSFWLDQDATPARVTLGVLTVLTMTTLVTTSNSGMPKVSYFKSIDIFLG